MTDSNTEKVFEELLPKRVLAVGAHADDIDVMAAGSIAAWIEAGARVEYLVLTDGGKGSEDRGMTTEELRETRREEQRAAARLLGVKGCHFLSYEDGQLEVSMELKRDIVRIIRKIKPDTVVVMDPTLVYSVKIGMLNHPDHRAAGQATLDAVYPLARDHLSFPELLDEKLEPHKVSHVLLTNYESHNYLVDICDSFETKLAALEKHVSQFTDQQALRSWLTKSARQLGKEAGCRYAESFVRIDLAR
jgi:LmbE family N-acetylglucosaminyl deacetylase